MLQALAIHLKIIAKILMPEMPQAGKQSRSISKKAASNNKNLNQSFGHLTNYP